MLTESDPDLRDRIAVRTLDGAAIELYEAEFGQPGRATPAQVRAAIAGAKGWPGWQPRA